MRISFLKDNIDINETYKKICISLHRKFNAYNDYVQWIIFNSHLKKNIITTNYNGNINVIDFNKNIDITSINLLFPFQCGGYLCCFNTKNDILIMFYHNDQYIYSSLRDKEFTHFIKFLYQYINFNDTYQIFYEQFQKIITTIKAVLYFLQKL